MKKEQRYFIRRSKNSSWSIAQHFKMNHCVQNIFRLVLLLFVVGVVVYICFPYETLFVRPPTVLIQRHKKQEKCNCTRAILPNNDTIDGISSLCSDYATQRGPHQRVIAISLFGPKENTDVSTESFVDFSPRVDQRSERDLSGWFHSSRLS